MGKQGVRIICAFHAFCLRAGVVGVLVAISLFLNLLLGPLGKSSLFSVGQWSGRLPCSDNEIAVLLLYHGFIQGI
jgi:hypothetical protein